jgi:glycosyltransferase involved in cell wall biosynthesis
VPYVTLEDMTLRQGVEIHPVFSQMSARGVAGWESRRADIYGRARRCTVASHWAADSLIDDYGLQPEQVAVVGFGANHRAGVHDREWGPPHLLFVGVDWERKGGPFVLRAFARLRDVIPGATLDVVGGHPLLLPANADHRETMAALFARATCFVMPSLVEPFGIAYVEAALAGVPSIASSVGGPTDIVGAEGGILVEPADERGLFEAMLRLADPDTARRMGAAANARSALYTWPKVAERLLRALGLRAPDERDLAEYL